MNSIQRFNATLNYQGSDRLPTKHYGTPEINQVLRQHFGLATQEELLLKLGDDFRSVEPRYTGPELRTFPDGSWEGLWGERYTNWSFGGGGQLATYRYRTAWMVSKNLDSPGPRLRWGVSIAFTN